MPFDEPTPPPNQIDKVWLTALLKRNGALTSGEIRNIAIGSSASTNSHITRIRIGYGGGTQGEPPQSLILKTVEAGTGFVNDSEVNYYARDYLRLADAPIPNCYAAHAADDGSYSILMEDLSDTHEKDTKLNLEFGLWRGRFSTIACFCLGRRTDPSTERTYTGKVETRPIYRTCQTRLEFTIGCNADGYIRFLAAGDPRYLRISSRQNVGKGQGHHRIYHRPRRY